MEDNSVKNNSSQNIDNNSITIDVPSIKSKSNISSIKDSRNISAGNFYESKLQKVDEKLKLYKEEKMINSEKSIDEKKDENLEKKDNFEKLEEKISKEKDFAPIELFNFYYSQPNEHYFCKDCGLIPIVQFLNTTDIIYLCNCKNKTSCKEKINAFLAKKITKIKEKDEINFKIFYCQEHKNQNYCYYCKRCKKNLCRKCIREKNEHKGHQILLFDELMNETDKKIKFIKEKFYLNSNSFESQSSDFLEEKNRNKIQKNNDIMKLMNVIFNDYNSKTNYSHFQIIMNFAQFIDDMNQKNSKDINELSLNKEVKILDLRELKRHSHNPELIIKITIENNNFNDLTELCKMNLINLKHLKLRENNISNLEPLVKAKFKNIKKINLAVNKIGDNNIEYLCKLDFIKLEFLNLYGNSLTDFKFFEIFNNKNLYSLKKLYIGSNLFSNSKTDIIFNSYNLKEIGFTNGIFNNNTIHIINNFLFNNLEIIYFSKNNLTSLSFIEKLDLPNIKQFWIYQSFIKDYYPLIKYKTLTKINLRHNEISNIDNLIPFINYFKDLEELNISENSIDLNDEKNWNILLNASQKLAIFTYI